jgi:putative ABC transport system ATP-binding protein
MNDSPYITFKNVSKSYLTPTGTVDILENVSFSINAQERIAIVGPSGSGKTTALSLLAGLDRPSSGSIVVGGKEISALSEKELAVYRNREMGIIFQSFELILPFTVNENITAPLDIAKRSDSDRVDALIDQVSLTHRREAYPVTLSGGEKQRVAIARALSNDPSLILADEPTGSLDQKTGATVLDMLLAEVEKEHKTLIVITHDESIAARMDRVFKIADKQIHETS